MKNIFGCTGGGQGPPNNPDRDEKREAIKKSPKKSDRNL